MQHSEIKWQFIGVILIAMSLIPLGDTAGKLMIQHGFSTHFVAWSRLFIGALCLFPFSGLQRSELAQLFNWRIILRALIFVFAISSILKALQSEPIANVFGAFFIGPILSYFLAAFLLKEQISLKRSVLLIIGFCGALLVIKPGFGMTTGIAYAVLAGCFYGCLLVANRWLAGQFRPRFILFSTLVIGSVVLLPFSLQTLPAISIKISGLVLLSALASAIGNLLIIEANRKLPASIVAPFVYTQLIAATLFGYIVFATLPDTWSLLGLLVLSLSGFASFFVAKREK